MKLRQFDLHLGFKGASASGEDVQDELRAIQNPDTHPILKGFPLGRCELVVEDDEIRVGDGHGLPKLVDLTLSDVKA